MVYILWLYDDTDVIVNSISRCRGICHRGSASAARAGGKSPLPDAIQIILERIRDSCSAIVPMRRMEEPDRCP